MLIPLILFWTTLIFYNFQLISSERALNSLYDENNLNSKKYNYLKRIPRQTSLREKEHEIDEPKSDNDQLAMLKQILSNGNKQATGASAPMFQSFGNDPLIQKVFIQ